MVRWKPDARGRLAEAAMILFIERGYDEVTVADIAERAGLTKRSFFNHFADKREAAFASVDALQESVLAALAEADADLGPLDAAVWAFAQAAAPVENYPDLARARQALIDSCPELQERDLMKRAAMASAVAGALERRGVPRRSAAFAAQVATTVFTTALDDWIHEPERGLGPSIQGALDDLRTSLGSEDQGAHHHRGRADNHAAVLVPEP
jgi:AcrR family transcriptional regulator